MKWVFDKAVLLRQFCCGPNYLKRRRISLQHEEAGHALPAWTAGFAPGILGGQSATVVFSERQHLPACRWGVEGTPTRNRGERNPPKCIKTNILTKAFNMLDRTCVGGSKVLSSSCTRCVSNFSSAPAASNQPSARSRPLLEEVHASPPPSCPHHNHSA